MKPIPDFTESDVALLVTAVRQALERLRDANERAGGSDPELIEYGVRYSRLLEKLEVVVR
ncbi:MAG: hypothetical protein SFV54_04755 [Bryobacteraceae bacterium]|nr:hypothetical protein [Bryobacteraceae bacterium]